MERGTDPSSNINPDPDPDSNSCQRTKLDTCVGVHKLFLFYTFRRFVLILNLMLIPKFAVSSEME